MPEELTAVDGEAVFYPAWLSDSEASHYLQQLLVDIPWHCETYTMYGKSVVAPRLLCWMGDADAEYRYSGVTHTPLPWMPAVTILKERVEQTATAHFNSVLANLYRDGHDSIGWHSDNEKELGSNPTIVSLSLGDTRLFKMRHKKSGAQIDVELAAGSLLIMRGAFQHHWQHCVPKTKLHKNARINLTFRHVHTST